MKNKKIAAAAAALGLAAMSYASVPMSAGAVEKYTAVGGGTFTFDKYLVMHNDATVPNVDFEFSVAPASNITDPDVKPGLEGIKFVAGTDVTVDSADNTKAVVGFSSDDETAAELEKGSRTITFATTDNTEDEKFASKKLTLDLSGVSFTEPGIYRYVITETNTVDVAGVSPDTDNTRYLDIYVEDEASELKVQGFILYIDADNKSTGFTNLYGTNNLTIAKNVSGNQGSKDKHFKITVKLTNADELSIHSDDRFQISGNFEKEPEKIGDTIYEAADMIAANNVSYVTYSQLAEGYSFYLCNGHTVEIKGIPSGLGYTITENQESYSPSVGFASGGDNKTDDKTGDGADIEGVKVDGDGVAAADRTFTVTDSYLKKNAVVTFTNEKAGVIPTGVIMTAAGSAAIAAVGIAGVVSGAFYLRKKKSEVD